MKERPGPGWVRGAGGCETVREAAGKRARRPRGAPRLTYAGSGPQEATEERPGEGQALLNPSAPPPWTRPHPEYPGHAPRPWCPSTPSNSTPLGPWPPPLGPRPLILPSFPGHAPPGPLPLPGH